MWVAPSGCHTTLDPRALFFRRVGACAQAIVNWEGSDPVEIFLPLITGFLSF